jgi:hypothetical protein
MEQNICNVQENSSGSAAFLSSTQENIAITLAQCSDGRAQCSNDGQIFLKRRENNLSRAARNRGYDLFFQKIGDMTY